MPARILVGSCSWTDPTLIACGRFYPSGVTSAEARLRYYAEQFEIVEVDSTYYAPPSPRNSELWVARTPAGFVFDVKAFGLLTHHPAAADRLPDWLRAALPDEARGKRSVYARDFSPADLDRVWQLHRDALEPLAAAGKLGAVLFQFPPWFVRSRESREYLRDLPRPAAGMAHRGGVPRRRMDDRRVRRRHLAAAGRGRARLRSRRRATRVPEQHAAAGRGDGGARGGPAPRAQRRHVGEPEPGRRQTASEYLYDEGELKEWVPRVRELAAQTQAVHVLFNNNYEDWGMQNARRMAHLLGVEAQPPQAQLDLG